MRLFTIDIKQNSHFGSHDMAVLYCCNEACYNEVELYLGLHPIVVCSNDGPRMTLTNFRARLVLET